LGKTNVQHRIDKTHGKSLYRGGNPQLTSRFCEDELDPKNFNMVSAWQLVRLTHSYN